LSCVFPRSSLNPSIGTCVDYPEEIEAPSIEQFYETNSDLDDGIFLRWTRPQEYGLDISGYRVEYKKLSSIDMRKRKKDKKIRKSITSTTTGNSDSIIHGAGTKVDGSVTITAKIHVESDDQAQINLVMINRFIDSVVLTFCLQYCESVINGVTCNSVNIVNVVFFFCLFFVMQEKEFIENETAFGGDVAGLWETLQTVPQDLSANHFSIKIRIGASEQVPLHPGRKYKFRVSSYARSESDKSFLFFVFGKPTKEFSAKEAVRSKTRSNSETSKSSKKTDQMKRKQEVGKINKEMIKTMTFKKKKKKKNKRKDDGGGDSGSKSGASASKSATTNPTETKTSHASHGRKKTARFSLFGKGKPKKEKLNGKPTKTKQLGKTLSRSSMIEMPTRNESNLITKPLVASKEIDASDDGGVAPSAKTPNVCVPIGFVDDDRASKDDTRVADEGKEEGTKVESKEEATVQSKKGSKKPSSRFSMLARQAVNKDE
jgi:hypothetical protein